MGAACEPSKQDRLRSALLTRAFSVLEQMVAMAPAKLLQDALIAPTDADTLALLLNQSHVLRAIMAQGNKEVADPAMDLGRRRFLLALSGGTLSSKQVGHILGISPELVNRRRRNGVLLAIRMVGGWQYPACQLDVTGTIPGIEDIVRACGASGPWRALEFLLTPNPALKKRTPLEALRKGERDAVLKCLRSVSTKN